MDPPSSQGADVGRPWRRQTAFVALLLLLLLSPGCMMPPMMGMHGVHEKEDSRAEREQAQALGMLRRVEELLSAQRILAGQLPESAEKRELLDRLDRMRREVQELAQSWEERAKEPHDMGGRGH